MKIYCIGGRGYSSNTYVLENNGEAFIFDPSVKANEISALLESIGALPVGIILTHGHFDHTLTLAETKEKFGVPVLIHTLDNEMLTDSEKNAGKLLLWKDFDNAPADKTFEGGDKLVLGGDQITVLHTPGHTKGSCCFAADGIMVSGDTIFACGFGRYDLYGGDGAVLFKTLEGFKNLDLSIKIYPGHGESATLASALKSIGILN